MRHTAPYVNLEAMPRKKTREEAKLHSREALLEAATRLFAKRGIDAPSLDEICARAGYTRGAFYVHFKDRDALLVAVMERTGRRFLDTFLGPAGSSTVQDLGEIITRFIPALSSGGYPLTGSGGMRPYQLLDACARSRRIRGQYVALVQDCISRLAKSAAVSQKRGVIRRDLAPDQLGLLLVLVVIGVHTLHDLDVPIDLAAGAAQLLNLVSP